MLNGSSVRHAVDTAVTLLLVLTSAVDVPFHAD